MTSDPTKAQGLDTLGLFEEYKAALDDNSQVALRRQTADALFVTVNTVFLTALGIFAPAHLDSWSGPLSVVVVTLVATPINVLWRGILINYARSIEIRSAYIRDIEEEIMRFRQALGYVGLTGMYTALREGRQERQPAPNPQQRFASYFVMLYPCASIVAIVMSYAIQRHIIPPLISN